uniref:AAA domain-containing protein n=1 Tax=Meloidogyne hapla TaxID=6305 RepID=A0A1I8BXB4_MELHA
MSISDFFKTNSTISSPRSAGGKKTSNNNTPAKLPNGSEESGKSTIPWKVDQVLCQEEVVAVLNKCLNGADLPNILFYGPPGTGKTSCAIALCRQFFPSSQLYKDRVLELNASDERGISVVRNRIKEFARIAVSSSSSSSKTIPPLKIVILDEADAMTGPAQSALRRTMENETQTTRFFLICNYVTRIIEPLTSRCAKFRFKPLSADAQKERLLNISIAEKVNFDENAIEQLVSISNGDLRKSITLMQSMACSAVDNLISVEDVKEMSGEIPNKIMGEFIDIVKCLDQERVNRYAKKIVKNGFSVTQFLTQLLDIILKCENLKEEKKAQIFIKIAETEKCLIDGADEYLQILDLLLICQGCFAEMDD